MVSFIPLHFQCLSVFVTYHFLSGQPKTILPLYKTAFSGFTEILQVNNMVGIPCSTIGNNFEWGTIGANQIQYNGNL
jgi:hypothetical protein